MTEFLDIVLVLLLSGVLGTVHLHRWRERWITGFRMAARGEVALVNATLAFDQGHLTHPDFIAPLLTTIVFPFRDRH